MNKINWELKIDGKFKKDYDLDEIDYIADKIRDGQFSGEINVELEDELPDGLQKYIDGVGLNVLYRNYHKSTNGIWSRAEIEFEHEDEQCNPYYEVNIDFGCQDDTRNEQYSETMYFFKKGDEWTCIDDYCESCSCRGWIESNDEEGRDAIQRCDECKVFDTDEYAQKIYKEKV